MATVTTTATATLLSTITATASSPPAPTNTGPPPQGGILDGLAPNAYLESNPIQLFLIQACIIIIFCRLLYYPLSLVGQPRVIAEVVGGIVLGPSVMSRIPHFRDEIFPKDSLPVLNNVANLGLLLYLFVIGLEVDIRMFTTNWRVASSVGVASMVIPFGFGYAVAYGLYHEYVVGGEGDHGFGVYGLFIGTALAITAFPVLCRILSALDMLRTPVGVTTLAAGVGNDVVGWVLLALCVALVNQSSGLTALYVLLVCLGWILFLCFLVRPPFHWILRRSGAIQNGPSQGMVTLTLVLVFTSAWFTNIIGVHAIFGAFIVGLICPHDGGFAIKLTEKIEDIITVIFLPLYFALSGLNTNLGLLDDGQVWGYVIAVIACAFVGKVAGGTLAARGMGLVWRESFSIGCLMSCKGLVELIVLNIGLQANILDQRVFTMFVVMALVTTVASTPLTNWLYPPWYRTKLEAWKRGEIDWDGNPLGGSDDSAVTAKALQDGKIRRLLVYLRLDSLPSIFTFITLLGEEPAEPKLTEEDSKSGSNEDHVPKTGLQTTHMEVHALRLLELTERTSSVMKVSEVDEYARRDPVLKAFETFSRLHDIATSGDVVITEERSYAQTLTTQASEQGSNFALIPWSEVGSNTEDQVVPFKISSEERFTSRSNLSFIQSVLSGAVCDTGIFIANGFGGVKSPPERPSLKRTVTGVSTRTAQREAVLPSADRSHHIFLPFIGGADDRAALRFVLQLARNPRVTATIARLADPEADADDEVSGVAEAKDAISAETTAEDNALFSTMRSSLPAELSGRVKFVETAVTTTTTAATTARSVVIKEAIEEAKRAVGQNPRNAGDIVVVGRSHPRLSTHPLDIERQEIQRVIGVLGERILAESFRSTSILIIQAAATKTTTAATTATATATATITTTQVVGS